MYKVYVGTLNPVKLAAVEEVCEDKIVIGMDVDSEVGSQPKSDEETVRGAKMRALKLPADGLRIGLEAGVTLFENKLFLINWGVLIDVNNNMFYAGGTRIPLPNAIKMELEKEDVELAEAMDAYFHTKHIKYKEGAVGLLTNNYVVRKDIFVHITKLLIGQYERHIQYNTT